MDFIEGKYLSEEVNIEELIKVVKIMLFQFILLDNLEGFIMVVEVLEEFKIGFNWSVFFKFLVYGCGEWNILFILSLKLGWVFMVSVLF